MKRFLKSIVGRGVRDPDVVKYQGKYYLCYVSCKKGMEERGVCIACSDHADAFDISEDNFVYITENGKPWSYELWAPELHFIDEKWYIYLACDDGNNENHRMYVLTNNSDNPLAPYSLLGKISDSADKWAIDGTVMKHNDELFFIWSGWDGDENVEQNLYIARMKNAYELASERVLISKPDRDWEQGGGTGTVGGLPFINEGPFAFCSGDQTFIAYSASGSWCEKYCIALLKLVGDDPMKPTHWKKLDSPILCANDVVKGAGHCSIVTEDDGTHLVYFHAWNKDEANVRWDTVDSFYAKLIINGDDITIR